MIEKTAILLVNLGTPDSPSVRDVRKYLKEFLNDPLVIDLPYVFRKILVNLIIVPFRAHKSSKSYKHLWEKHNGESPILTYGLSVQKKLQSLLNNSTVRFAMRYGNPSMNTEIIKLYKEGINKIVLFPLYPQYATATTLSTIIKARKIIMKLQNPPKLEIIDQFYQNAAFIDTWKKHVSKIDFNKYDHILFSFHGLPKRQLKKVHGNISCETLGCKSQVSHKNANCYQATVYETARTISRELSIPKEKYTISFQSRLGKGWVEPFTDATILKLAKTGAKKLLVFSPAFVTDCLETSIEIEEGYNALFKAAGGTMLTLVPGLNDDNVWIKALLIIIKES